MAKKSEEKKDVVLTVEQELEQVKAELETAKEALSKNLEKKKTQKEKSPVDKMVKINLFYDGNLYKDPIYVSVNGESLIIPRGVEVEIPQRFKEVVDRSIAQEQKTSAYYQTLERLTAQNMNGIGQTLVDVKP